MKRTFFKSIAIALATVCICSSCSSNLPATESVREVADRVADWQVRHFDDQAQFRAPWNGKDVRNNKKYHDLQWQQAAFYIGLYEYSTQTDQPQYVDWLQRMGAQHSWSLHKRQFHADDHAVGQFYLNLAKYYDKPAYYAPLQAQFDGIMADEKAYNWHWWWCDALYMAPPVWVRLAKFTGDSKYLDYMDRHYKMTYEKLWSEEDHLFFRDMRLLEKKEKNGESTFWARGNGWVLGGLALMIPDMPEDWAGREFYIDLFKTMAVKIKSIQREDGTWSAGLLGSIEDYPYIETSGTSFFTFALAWGINNGILDRRTYEDSMLRGWEAIANAVNEEGMVTYVQGVGFSPNATSDKYTEVYGSGAFLTAAAEMLRYIENFK